MAGVLLLAGCASRDSIPPEAIPRDAIPRDAIPALEDGGQRVGNLVVRNVPAIPEGLQARMRQYLEGRRAYVHGWLGDGLFTVPFSSVWR